MRTHKKLIKVLSWMAVVIWMMFIFKMSSQPAELSDGLSRGVVKVIVDTIEKVAPKAKFDINRLNHLLMKNAHFSTDTTYIKNVNYISLHRLTSVIASAT